MVRKARWWECVATGPSHRVLIREHRERNASVSFQFLLDIQFRILAHGLELPTIREGLSSSVKLKTPEMLS